MTEPANLTPILRLAPVSLADWCRSIGQSAYRAAQISRWIYQRRVERFETMTDLPKLLRVQLARQFRLFGTEIADHHRAADGTEKLLLRLDDGRHIESVLMRSVNRRPICISTQVGCGMGCVFCASGLQGVTRNLQPDEIIEQVLRLRNLLPPEESITHIVVMGMGESLANLTNLLAALDRITAPDGLGLGQRRVTISTVGLPAKIRDLADRGTHYNLAVSLHAPTDELRSQLVPPNRTIGIAPILAATDYYFQRTGRQVTFEYVLLQGINDGPAQSAALARQLAGRKAHVNLIPYNPVEGLPYARPRPAVIAAFAQTLRQAGVSVKVRQTRGRAIDAACGQLRCRFEAPVPIETRPGRPANPVPT